jgi:hypothetical protein
MGLIVRRFYSFNYLWRHEFPASQSHPAVGFICVSRTCCIMAYSMHAHIRMHTCTHTRRNLRVDQSVKLYSRILTLPPQFDLICDGLTLYLAV